MCWGMGQTTLQQVGVVDWCGWVTRSGLIEWVDLVHYFLCIYSCLT
jgi:hypothetical protein